MHSFFSPANALYEIIVGVTCLAIWFGAVFSIPALVAMLVDSKEQSVKTLNWSHWWTVERQSNFHSTLQLCDDCLGLFCFKPTRHNVRWRPLMEVCHQLLMTVRLLGSIAVLDLEISF